MGYPKLFFDNRFADAAPSASSTASGNFNAANVADMRPYTWWKSNGMPATLTVDCGSAKAANFALVWGHDLFTHGATCEVRGSTDNFSSSNVLVASVTPTDNNPLVLEFNGASYRYWRLRFTGSGNPSIAIAMIGTAFAMPIYMPAGFDPMKRAVVAQSNNNENGHSLGKIINFDNWKQTLKFIVPQAWLRSTWQQAWRSNLRGSPFAFAWDSVNFPAELQLVLAGDSYASGHRAGGNADLSFDVSGVAQ